MEPARCLTRIIRILSMRVSPQAFPVWVMPFLLVSVVIAAGGCSRTGHRLQADREAYDVIAERNDDPRWHAADYGIEIDPRSRYFDPCDPDRPPMPPDDPASHEYMRRVAGMKGWEHWHDSGDRVELENPEWREALAEYVEVGGDGSVKLNIDSALQLAYVHSPSHQNQLEALYLSALDVTTERFRLDTQFFGGYDARYSHDGSLRDDRLTVGRSSAGDPALQARQRFASAGELLIGFANSFVVEFGGSGTNFASSLANFSFIQPLLRGAGRDVALEQLTFVERVLLANLRAYHQYRQGFYTRVAIGELGVGGPQRGGGGTVIAGFPGQGTVGGYIGLLQQLQQIRNTEDSLSLQLRTLSQLEAHLDGGVIDLVQVDQFRQSIENERADLLQTRNGFELSLDRYKTGTLGLPPDLPIALDDSLIRQFQLVAREATAIQDSIAELQDRVGELPDDASVEPIRQVLTDAFKLVEPIRCQLNDVQADIARMEEAVPAREQTMTDVERRLFQRDREQLREGLAELKQQFEQAKSELKTLRDGLSEETKDATVSKNVVWLGDLLRLVQGSILVQARARLEAVTVDTIELSSRDAFGIALANRMDFMNGRAALVDSWRLIQFKADALQSVLNVTADGDIRTARNNPVSFRGSAGNLRLGLEFDAPFTRLLERNNYRQSLIDYQRDRRDFIQSRDSLHLGLRGLIRQIEQLRTDLEIQRRAVAIAIRRVDLTRAALYAPVRPPQPGQRPAQFGPTAATNLLTALSALRNTQNNFLSVWLNYYAARMRLARELGIMMLDHDGSWIDDPIPNSSLDDSSGSDKSSLAELPLPPAVPTEWIELTDRLPQEPDALPSAEVEASDGSAASRPIESDVRQDELVVETDHVD
ncbi:MAG TPA: TolC family protein [Sedimentisphaerales bacterium]|nr:TolC family protein [Sedimentisphaerales bacterium]